MDRSSWTWKDVGIPALKWFSMVFRQATEAKVWDLRCWRRAADADCHVAGDSRKISKLVSSLIEKSIDAVFWKAGSQEESLENKHISLLPKTVAGFCDVSTRHYGFLCKQIEQSHSNSAGDLHWSERQAWDVSDCAAENAGIASFAVARFKQGRQHGHMPRLSKMRICSFHLASST